MANPVLFGAKDIMTARATLLWGPPQLVTRKDGVWSGELGSGGRANGWSATANTLGVGSEEVGRDCIQRTIPIQHEAARKPIACTLYTPFHMPTAPLCTRRQSRGYTQCNRPGLIGQA